MWDQTKTAAAYGTFKHRIQFTCLSLDLRIHSKQGTIVFRRIKWTLVLRLVVSSVSNTSLLGLTIGLKGLKNTAS